MEYQVMATAQLPARDDDVWENEYDNVTKSTGQGTRTATFQKSSPDATSLTNLRELRPNSIYPFRVRARSQDGWGGYSKEVNCTVPPLAVPFPPPAPIKNDDAATRESSDRTIPMWLYGAPNRYGPVGCYQVVVIELKNGATTDELPAPQNLEVFNNYSQAAANYSQSAGKNYIAYVAAAHRG
ncbi:uncharacterized protein LOC118432274 [Branchiostoma floridae]|uniref:Uncharacterized protein LOC118432274 n=1 Tax=Branchiostoma floridae TaxID=7739 RepID=A0A9J7MED6_BRAFL|nr:uncharacterized protein LOC118432274 [Branchiostoma floridae]